MILVNGSCNITYTKNDIELAPLFEGDIHATCLHASSYDVFSIVASLSLVPALSHGS